MEKPTISYTSKTEHTDDFLCLNAEHNNYLLRTFKYRT